MRKRILGILLSICMIFSMLQIVVFAVDGDVPIGANAACTHHTEHTADCGYVEAVAEQPCEHKHDETCGYAEELEGTPAQEEVPCDKECTDTDEDGIIDHMEGCAYTPAVEEVPAVEGKPCNHTHDSTCGYGKAIEGKPCTFVCKICNPQEKVCTCAPVIQGEGEHTNPDCPLYITLTKTDYEKVVELFLALPKADSISAETTDEEKTKIFAMAETAMAAYNALSEENKAKFEEEHMDLLVAALALNDALTGNVPATMELTEQFDLAANETYYFDLSSQDVVGTITDGVSDKIGTINTAIPDTTLHYVPFTYVGTVNAYSRTGEGVSTDSNVTVSDRSLFVADYNVSHTVSWNTLNDNGLIFGKTFDTDYTLRSLSAGSAANTPASNEWDRILAKSDTAIKNRNDRYSWGQDTVGIDDKSRVVRGKKDTDSWKTAGQGHDTTLSGLGLGWRPALEVLNPATLNTVTLDLNGGKLKNSAVTKMNIVYTGGTYTAPDATSLTPPTENPNISLSWNTQADGNGTTYEVGAGVPNTVPTLYAMWEEPPVAEQFNLATNKTYYFDLSSYDKIGTTSEINTAIPDPTLHYVPFTYVGTMNAYVLKSASSGITTASDEASKTNKPDATYGYIYDHSLFVADYNVSHSVNWSILNDNNLIFGKTFDNNYTLRSLSVGSADKTPTNNEWDKILAKSDTAIKNWSGIYSWGQDTTTNTDSSYRAVRGHSAADKWFDPPVGSYTTAYGWRPVLEVMNPAQLGKDGLKTVTLNLNGGKLKNSDVAEMNIVYTGETYTAPDVTSLTRPTGNTGTYFSWNTQADGKGTTYEVGAGVPNTVPALYAMWEEPPVAEQFDLATNETYYFDLSDSEVVGTITDGVSDKVGTISKKIPDTTLHYVPFTYVGTINAYALKPASSGNLTTSAEASKTDDPNATYGYTYDHSLFVADYNVSHTVSWDTLNTNSLIFGKPFNTNYTLRSLSAGGTGGFGSAADLFYSIGEPTNNEWDRILEKSDTAIKNPNGIYSFGQDTAKEHTEPTSLDYRAIRGYDPVTRWGDTGISADASFIGWRPSLEVLNPTALTADGLKVVTLHLNGGTFNGANSIKIVCAGDNFTAPDATGLTPPIGNPDMSLSWNTQADGKGTTYEVGASVPNTVPALYAIWEEPYTAVTNITGVSSKGKVDEEVALTGTVEPNNATNQTITWSIKTDGGTEATITSNKLTAKKAGTVTVTATVVNGKTASTDYTQDFEIVIARKDYSGSGATAPIIGKATNTTITISTVKGQEYVISTSETSPTNWSGDGYLKAESSEKHTFTGLTQGTKYYIHTRTAETDTTMPSPSVKVEQYTLPDTPLATVVTIDYAKETISFDDTKYEVSTKNDGTGDAITGAITPSDKEQKIYVRVKANGEIPASEWQEITIIARPTKPNAVLIEDVSKTDTKITIANIVATQEYSKDGGTTWQDDGTFTDLTPNTEYHIVTRVKATDDTFASVNSDSLAVTTKMATSDVPTPSAPTIGKATNTTITISTVKGQEYVISESETPPTNWSGDGYLKAESSGSHTFKDLTPGTKYYIHTRTAETDEAMPSDSAKVEQYTLPDTPLATVVTIDYATETISFGAEYEVSTKNDGNGEAITGAITPSDTEQKIYVRVKEANGVPASEWCEITILARPAIGTTLTVDTATEAVDVPAGYTYKIGNSEEKTVTVETSVKVAPTETLTYWKTATEKAFKSESKDVIAPERLATISSETFQLNGKTETMPTKTTMQYKTPTNGWETCTADMKLTDFGWNGTADKTITVQMKATSENYASDPIKYTIPARTAEPTAEKTNETIDGKADGKISNVSSDMEYKLSTDKDWTAITGETVDNLPDGTYYVRTKATDTAVYSKQKELTIAKGETLTLTFDTQDGTSVGKIENLVWQSKVTPPTTTRQGYTFDGWWTEKDGKGTQLTNKTLIEENITYYANWTANVYSVTFKANYVGSTHKDVVQNHTYDSALPLTENAFTRTGYTFSGWNTKSDGTGTAYTNKQSVKNLFAEQNENLDLYAQWTELNRSNLSGVVTSGTDPDSVKIEGATVTLKQGEDVFATTTTDSEGKYRFTNILPGIYNLIVTKDDKTITVIFLAEKNETVKDYKKDISMPSEGTKNSILEIKKEDDIKEDVPKIVVGGLEKEADEQNKDILMTVEQKKETESNEIQTAIKEEAKQSIAMFLDITVKNGSDTMNTTNNVLEIIVPFNFDRKTNIQVFSHHDGTVEKFEVLENRPTESFKDKTVFMDKENNLLYVYSQKFSTYAVGYTTVSGGGSSSHRDRYNIKITQEGKGTVLPNSDINIVKIVKGFSQTFTFTPDKGYVVSDVFVDDSSVGAKADYTFENVTDAHTLKVIFKVADEPIIPKPEVDFKDITESNWFYNDVVNAVEKGWFAGISDIAFGPYLSTTRGMIATTLWRMENKPEVTAVSDFEDVVSGSWYYNGVIWSQEKGVVSGYGNGKFGPADNITREQMASILYRYAQFKGYDVSKTASLDSFTDGSTTSNYAKTPMSWAVANGLISGKGNGILDPKGNATRAEAATILTRFDALFSEK